ncbi:MAG: hypothetical protein ACLTCV_04920 [Oscillospiraceae bacterium]
MARSDSGWDWSSSDSDVFQRLRILGGSVPSSSEPSSHFIAIVRLDLTHKEEEERPAAPAGPRLQALQS